MSSRRSYPATYIYPVFLVSSKGAEVIILDMYALVDYTFL